MRARSWRSSGCRPTSASTAGFARMSDPEMIQGIQEAVTIPVMAMARIGHFVEAQILEALGGRLHRRVRGAQPADETHHIDKWAFTVPFVCGATNLGEALRRISEGACMIRSKGEAGTGNIVEAVRHLRSITATSASSPRPTLPSSFEWAKRLQAPLPLVPGDRRDRLAAGAAVLRRRHRHAADAALAMQLGAEAVFVGSGIFKSDDPAPRAKAIVEATTNYMDPHILVKVSRGPGAPMTGIGMDDLDLSSPTAAGELGRAGRRPRAPGCLRPAPAGARVARLRRCARSGGPSTSRDWTDSWCPAVSRPPCRCSPSGPACSSRCAR